MDLTAKSFAPERVRNSKEARDYLPIDGFLNNVFELMHKPLDWEAKDGRWLPVLSPIFFLKALNNYDEHGHVDPEAVRRIYRAKGCTIIVPDDDRLGEYKHYVATVPATNPQFGSVGKYYLTIFESPEMVAGKVIWRRDESAYDAFRAHLVDAGIVAMNSTIAELVISAKRESLTTMEQVPLNTESKRKTIAKLQADITAMEALLVGLEKPKAARTKRSAFRVERDTNPHGE